MVSRTTTGGMPSGSTVGTDIAGTGVAGEVGAGVDVGLAVGVGLLAGCRPAARATAPTTTARATAAAPAATSRLRSARVEGIETDLSNDESRCGPTGTPA